MLLMMVVMFTVERIHKYVFIGCTRPFLRGRKIQITNRLITFVVKRVPKSVFRYVSDIFIFISVDYKII